MIRLEIGLEIRHRGVMSLCAIEDKSAVVVVVGFISFVNMAAVNVHVLLLLNETFSF